MGDTETLVTVKKVTAIFLKGKCNHCFFFSFVYFLSAIGPLVKVAKHYFLWPSILGATDS